MSNNQKKLKEAIMKSMLIAATTQTEDEMARAMRSLPRRDRRILVREGKKRQDKMRKTRILEEKDGSETGNI